MKTVLLILAVVLVIAIAYGAYAGVFTGVAVSERDHTAFTFVYREIGGGEMGQIGPITTWIDSVLQQAGLTDRKPLDIFFPDGRGEIGFAVDGATAAQLASFGANAKVRVIPAQRYMVAEFPWKSRASYMIGYAKVDPKLAQWRTEHRYKKVEALALNEGKTILYLQPIVPTTP